VKNEKNIDTMPDSMNRKKEAHYNNKGDNYDSDIATSFVSSFTTFSNSSQRGIFSRSDCPHS
jgi:hypothetical protein